MLGRDASKPMCFLAVAIIAALPRVAEAAAVCDAGAACSDEDKDGFAKCGCPWSGTPCDCDDADPMVFPGAPETCDSAIDNNCNGVVADRCPTAHGCLASACVPECVPLDDFGCVHGSSFLRTPDSGICLCEPRDCTLFGCPAGFTCSDERACVPNCGPDVRCPYGQLCRGFGCVDPCSDVACPEGSVCTEGRCQPSCACAPTTSCPQGETCDETAPVPKCTDPACVGVRCPAGSHCDGGTCMDDCAGTVCPPKRVCRKVSVNGAESQAKCVDLCSPDPCESGFECQWRTGACTPIPVPEGGLTAPPERVEALEVVGGGWLCSASGFARASALTGAGAVAFAAFALRRRRRRDRGAGSKNKV